MTAPHATDAGGGARTPDLDRFDFVRLADEPETARQQSQRARRAREAGTETTPAPTVSEQRTGVETCFRCRHPLSQLNGVTGYCPNPECPAANYMQGSAMRLAAAPSERGEETADLARAFRYEADVAEMAITEVRALREAVTTLVEAADSEDAGIESVAFAVALTRLRALASHGRDGER